MSGDHLKCWAPNFSRSELESSDTAARLRIPNTCPDALLPNLIRMSWALEAARAIVGPLRVTSGYRSPGLNASVGSKASSAHLAALAADVMPVRLSLEAAWAALTSDPEWMYGIDQLIYESGGNLHIGLAPGSKAPRMELRRDQWDGGVRSYPLIGHWSPQGILYA